MVMPLMVRIWVFATRVSRPLALAAATGEVRRTPEVKRRAARSRVDRVEVEHSAPEETCAGVCVGGVMLTRRHNRVRRAFCDALAEKRRGRIYLRGCRSKKITQPTGHLVREISQKGCRVVPTRHVQSFSFFDFGAFGNGQFGGSEAREKRTTPFRCFGSMRVKEGNAIIVYD